MNVDAIPIGINPPHDVNVIIEVPIGGAPIKYEIDKGDADRARQIVMEGVERAGAHKI